MSPIALALIGTDARRAIHFLAYTKLEYLTHIQFLTTILFEEGGWRTSGNIAAESKVERESSEPPGLSHTYDYAGG
jgi:hypothetical protein